MDRVSEILKALGRVSLDDLTEPGPVPKELGLACSKLKGCWRKVLESEDRLACVGEVTVLGEVTESSATLAGVMWSATLMVRVGMVLGRIQWWDRALTQGEIETNWQGVADALPEYLAGDWDAAAAQSAREAALLSADDRDESTRVTMEKLDQILDRHPVDVRFLTVSNAAVYCSLSEKTIRGWLSDGELTGLRPCPGRILIDRRELDSLIGHATRRPAGGRGSGATFGRADG